ncbi:hypothetical protein L249_4792 [Ophiocordyceps polyrhachis-furcata BCC 54312]|uniref:Transmembrane protein n=1 Tax=Ophiocordyceps polyrhachis-furcata BCC 54312 TaxID=1330021 RepID=A0A367L2J6_9HYPO|nr:hypothetical protein L249_4792 [Ophiocordyceps polyrhachis-furcata BCC 54312]
MDIYPLTLRPKSSLQRQNYSLPPCLRRSFSLIIFSDSARNQAAPSSKSARKARSSAIIFSPMITDCGSDPLSLLSLSSLSSSSSSSSSTAPDRELLFLLLVAEGELRTTDEAPSPAAALRLLPSFTSSSPARFLFDNANGLLYSARNLALDSAVPSSASSSAFTAAIRRLRICSTDGRVRNRFLISGAMISGTAVPSGSGTIPMALSVQYGEMGLELCLGCVVLDDVDRRKSVVGCSREALTDFDANARWKLVIRCSRGALSVLGLSVLGLSVLGLFVLGLSLPAFVDAERRKSVLGCSRGALSVLGLSVLGLSLTDLDANARWKLVKRCSRGASLSVSFGLSLLTSFGAPFGFFLGSLSDFLGSLFDLLGSETSEATESSATILSAASLSPRTPLKTPLASSASLASR